MDCSKQFKFTKEFVNFINSAAGSFVIWLVSMSVIWGILSIIDKQILPDIINQQTGAKQEAAQKTSAPSNKPQIKEENENTKIKKNKDDEKEKALASEKLKKIETYIVDLSPKQQHALRLAVALLYQYEKFVQAKIADNQIAKKRIVLLLNDIDKKLYTADKIARETVRYDICPQIEKKVTAGESCDYNEICINLVNQYRKNVEEHTKYSNGIHVKIWSGQNHKAWTSNFFDTPRALVTLTNIDSADIFDPMALMRPMYSYKKGPVTVCYKGYINVLSDDEYSFIVHYPFVYKNKPSSRFAIYIDNEQCVNAVSNEIRFSDKRDRKFTVYLKKGYHSFTLINEIDWRNPKVSNIQLYLLTKNKPMQLKRNRFFIKKQEINKK